MENKEILQEALAEFTIQWTEQFVSGCIIPNINKAFENELVCYCLLQWKRHYDNYKMDKIRSGFFSPKTTNSRFGDFF